MAIHAGFLTGIIDFQQSPLGQAVQLVPGVGTLLDTASSGAQLIGGESSQEIQIQRLSGFSGRGGMPAIGMADPAAAGVQIGSLDTRSAADRVIRARQRALGMEETGVGGGAAVGGITGMTRRAGLVTPGMNLEMSNTLSYSSGTAMRRPPRGYVTVVLDGVLLFMKRKLAISSGLWKAPKKPPISVRDWNCIMGANRVVKKLKSIESKVKRVANFRAPVRRQLVAPHPHTVKLPANIK